MEIKFRSKRKIYNTTLSLCIAPPPRLEAFILKLIQYIKSIKNEINLD